jgi:invasion protein IalB
MFRFLIIGCLASAFVLAAVVSAPAQSTKPEKSGAETFEPENMSVTYGDWVLRCTHTENAARACEVRQTLEVKGQGTVAQIALGRAAAKTPMLASVLLPVNVSFPSSVSMAVDEKDDAPAELVWKQCISVGCLAQVEVKDEALKRWRGQSGRGQIRFVTSAKQSVIFAFSFRGLSAALENLAKNSSQ